MMRKVNAVSTRAISGFNYSLPLVLELHDRVETTYKTFFPPDCTLFLFHPSFQKFQAACINVQQNLYSLSRNPENKMVCY